MIVKKGNQNSDCAIILTVHNHIEIFGLPCLQSLLKALSEETGLKRAGQAPNLCG